MKVYVLECHFVNTDGTGMRSKKVYGVFTTPSAAKEAAVKKLNTLAGNGFEWAYHVQKDHYFSKLVKVSEDDNLSLYFTIDGFELDKIIKED